MSSAQSDLGGTPRSRLRRISLTQWIIIAAFIGVGLGIFFPTFAVRLDPLSQIFLRMIKSLIVPLIFSTLVVGIAGHGDDMSKVGRLALRSLIYFELVTTGALVIGLAAVNLMKPGAGVSLGAATVTTGSELAAHPVTFAGVLEHTVPQSFFEAAYHNEVLQIVVFSIMFGVALANMGEEYTKPIVRALDICAHAILKMVGYIMWFAPLGVLGAIAAVVATNGFDIFKVFF